MRIAAIIPCHNEESSIGLVINGIRSELPNAQVFVCDNASTDQTRSSAELAGADVIFERTRGKGNAVRRLFRDVEADVYILIDGDNTYSTRMLREHIRSVIEEGFDMVTGERQLQTLKQRSGHKIGNMLFTQFLKMVFSVNSNDVFSGYRILSRRLVKTFPCISPEFEIEAELEIYSARMKLPTSSFPVEMAQRVNSESKLSTIRDGIKILVLATRMLHREYPLTLYSSISFVLFVGALVLFLPIYSEFLITGLVPRVPTVITCSTLGIASILVFITGFILKEITNSRYEARYLAYLSIGRKSINRE